MRMLKMKYILFAAFLLSKRFFIIAGRKPKPFNKFSETLTPEANRAYHYIINKFNQHYYFKTIGEQASEGDVFIAHQSLANAQIKEYIKSYTPDGIQLNQSNGRYYLQYKDTIATLFKLSLRRKTSEQAHTYSYKIWVLNNQNTTYYYFEKISRLYYIIITR